MAKTRVAVNKTDFHEIGSKTPLNVTMRTGIHKVRVTNRNDSNETFNVRIGGDGKLVIGMTPSMRYRCEFTPS